MSRGAALGDVMEGLPDEDCAGVCFRFAPVFFAMTLSMSTSIPTTADSKYSSHPHL